MLMKCTHDFAKVYLVKCLNGIALIFRSTMHKAYGLCSGIITALSLQILFLGS